MIKKLAALALALLMTLSLAACGSQKDDQAGGAVTPGVTGDAVPWMTAGISTPMSRSTSSTALSARAPATKS